MMPELWAVDGDVRGMAIVEDTLYVAGLFEYVGPPTGPLAVLDPTTGEADLSWDRLTGEVNAIEPDGAGGYFVGGQFHTIIDGIIYRNLVRLRPDGSIDPSIRPNPVVGEQYGRVGAIAYAPGSGPSGDGVLVIAGRFDEVSSPSGVVTRQDLAAIHLGTADVLPLSATFAGSNIHFGLRAVAHYDGAIYVGGSFDAVNGEPRTSIAAFDLDAGELLPWDVVMQPSDGLQQPIVFAIAVTDTTLYVRAMTDLVNGEPRDGLFEVHPADPATGAGGSLTVWAPQGAGGGTVLVVTEQHVWLASNFLPGPRVLARVDRVTAQAAFFSVSPDLRFGRSLAYDPQGGPSGQGVLYIGADRLEGSRRHPRVIAVDPATGQATGTEIAAAGTFSEQHHLPPNVMAVAPDGQLLAGGRFLVIGARRQNGMAAFDLTTGRALEDFPFSLQGEALRASPDGRFLYRYSISPFWLLLDEFDLATRTVRDFTEPGPLPPPPDFDWPDDVYVANARSGLEIEGDTLFVSLSGGVAMDRSDATVIWQTGMASIGTWHLDPGTALLIPAGEDSAFGSEAPTLILSGPFEHGPVSDLQDGFFALNALTGELSDWYPTVHPLMNPRGAAAEYQPAHGERPASLWLGGKFFGEVEGQTRRSVMALDPSSAGLLDWNTELFHASTGTEWPVHALLAIPEATTLDGDHIGGVIYTGGTLWMPDREPPLFRVIAYDATSGETLEWNPRIWGHAVRSILYSERHGAVFIGGNFTGALGGSGHVGVVAVSPYGWQPPVTTEPPEPERPRAAALSAPFPNPAGQAASLMLSLPDAATVEVALYDVLGRRVVVLHEGPLEAGEHALMVDTSRLAAGVYVVRAVGEGFSESQRITVVR